jgi:glycosyltransferase involved in cell wall biosynthesis
MKILVVCGAGIVSGVETVTLSLILGLRGRGHDVRCITSTWGNGDFARRLDDHGIPYTRLPLGFISKTLSWPAIRMTLDQLWRLPKLWLGYLRYNRDFDPEIILQSNFHHLFILWPLLNSRRTIFHVHNRFPPNRFYRIIFKFLNRRILKFIAVSQFVEDSIKKLGIPKEKIICIPNGTLDTSRCPPEGEPNHTSPTPFEGHPAAVQIGIVGQIGSWKGHDDLIEALRVLKGWDVEFSCLVFGSGDPDYIEALNQKIERYGLSKQIDWRGYVKDKESIFTLIDICVVPSRCEEGFGMVAVEAASFGVPVIATRIGGLIEIVKDGETGHLIDVESPGQVAEKLKTLIQDPDLREKMGRAARQHALQFYMLDRMIVEVETVLLNLVDKPSISGRQTK